MTRYRWLLDGPAGAYGWLTGTGRHDHDVPDAHDFTLSAHPAPPDWATDASVYEIFPTGSPGRPRRTRGAAGVGGPGGLGRRRGVPAARACRRQLFGGDLDGIVEHLDHIQGLGFDTIYLTPFFPAASNHRYDASSFDRVDPLLGGDDALARLSSAVHDRGMRARRRPHHEPLRQHARVVPGGGRRRVGAVERNFYYFQPDGSYVGWYDIRRCRSSDSVRSCRPGCWKAVDSVVGKWLGAPFRARRLANRRRQHDRPPDLRRHEPRRGPGDPADHGRANPDTVLVAEHCHDASGDLSGDGWHGAMNYAGFLRPVWSWLRATGYRKEFLGLPVDVPRLGGGVGLPDHARVPVDRRRGDH